MKSDKHAMKSCTRGEAEGNRHKVKGKYQGDRCESQHEYCLGNQWQGGKQNRQSSSKDRRDQEYCWEADRRILRRQASVAVDVIASNPHTITTPGKKQVFRQEPQVAENAVRHKDGLRCILENQPILAKQTVRRIRAWK
jgi:hypothetical protein